MNTTTTIERARPVVQVALAPRVRIHQAAQALGLTEKAIRRKIEARTWREGKEYHRDPLGQLWIDIKGVMAWIEGEG